MKSEVIAVYFKPEDLANSEIWWIKDYWKTICEIWKETKGYELEEVNQENILDFLELNMKTILFSMGGKND